MSTLEEQKQQIALMRQSLKETRAAFEELKDLVTPEMWETLHLAEKQQDELEADLEAELNPPRH